MTSRKILVISEGSDDKKFLKKLFEKYSNDTYQIFVYETDIYQFYEKYEETMSSLSDEERTAPNILLSSNIGKLPSPFDKNKLKANYSDILLVFDFDPQATQFSSDKILTLMNHFNDSTEYGRLYINYPMLESFRHIDKQAVKSCSYDTDFFNRQFNVSELGAHQYKGMINSSWCRYWKTWSQEKWDCVIAHHLKKLSILTNITISDFDKRNSQYHVLTHQTMGAFLEAQCKSVSKHKTGFVLNTSMLFFLDTYPKNTISVFRYVESINI